MTLAPPISDAPTQVTHPRPRVSDRVRRNAAMTAEQLSPGRYLAIEDGGEVVVIAVAGSAPTWSSRTARCRDATR